MLLLKPLLNNIFSELNISLVWANLIGVFGTLLIMVPFLWALIVKGVHKRELSQMLEIDRNSQLVVLPIMLSRYFIALFIVGWVVSNYVHLAVGLLLVVVIIVVIIAVAAKPVTDLYHKIENRFVTNLDYRQAQISFEIPEELENNFSLGLMTVSPYSQNAGKTLRECGFKRDYGVNVVSIERAGKIYDLPSKETILLPCDKISLIGNEDQLSLVRSIIEVEPDMLIHDHTDHNINNYTLIIPEGHALAGRAIREAKLMVIYNTMVIGIKRQSHSLFNPSADTLLMEGDILLLISPLDIDISELLDHYAETITHYESK